MLIVLPNIARMHYIWSMITLRPLRGPASPVLSTTQLRIVGLTTLACWSIRTRESERERERDPTPGVKDHVVLLLVPTARLDGVEIIVHAST